MKAIIEDILTFVPPEIRNPPENIWFGVSVEDRLRKDRINLLRNTPAHIRFLSIEPQLENIGDLHLGDKDCNHPHLDGIDQRPIEDDDKVWECKACGGLYFACDDCGHHPTIDQVIVGGESGPGAREFHVRWAEEIQEQCARAGVAFFLKQWGSNPVEDCDDPEHKGKTCIHRKLKDRKGGDPAEWPAHLRVREFPAVRPAEVPA